MTFDAVLFDCDGVLVDSEAITCGALRDMLDENGWRLSLSECMAHFVGHTVRSRADLIERHTGKPLTDAFMDEFYRRRNIRLENDITAMDGIHDAVRHVQERCEGHIAVASGADPAEVEFVARYRVAGAAVRLHERSRFVHEAGRWFYVDGDQRG